MTSAQRLTLAAAVLFAVAWLVWPAPERRTAPAEDTTVWERWGLEPADWPGEIDGRPWRPLSFLGETVALGTDTTGRLLYVEHTGGEATAAVVAEPDGAPGVVATAATGAHLAWIESTPDEQGRVASELWIAERGPDGRPGEAELLTAETGNVVVADSAYDLQFADGALHWLSTARSAERTTEHRFIGVDGGRTGIVAHPGAWQAAAWPWLAGAGALGGAGLLHTGDGTALRLRAGRGDLAMCSAMWCRVIATGAEGARIALVRPDGTGRVTVAEGFTSAVSTDVGLLDRFEFLEEPTSCDGRGRRLTLFDLEDARTYLVAVSAVQAGADARRLWWSPGSGDPRRWHVLDLTDLTH